MTLRETARAARSAATSLAAVHTDAKNQALDAIAEALSADRETLLEANRDDVKRSETEGLAAPLRKRLGFDAAKLDAVIQGIRSLRTLPDPVGRIRLARELDQGLELRQVSCPIGVIGVIFESRPDALVQISTLCLKSGNAVLLKGGSEAHRTNQALAEAIRRGGAAAGMPDGWLQLLTSREDVDALLALDDCVDLLIPRGSNDFVRYIMTHSAIPVLGHADGICHVFVDRDADLETAIEIVVDSKCQYVAVCNAVETLLVHEQAAADFLPRLQQAMAPHHVELRGCDRTRSYINIAPASPSDWETEYLDLILSIRVVRDVDEAIRHIHRYGSGHTDAIITRNADTAEGFLERVDSANVLWNCSTRFSDGFRYGLGAEVGISTSKIHARGPVGLEGLVTYKWILRGEGHIVAPYADGKRRFTHRTLPG